MSVSVSSLTKIYDSQKAVDAISFELNKGEIVGFLGPNGAGKSTTMKMLTAYLSPTSGTATVCGFDVQEQSMEVRKRIGYLPEHNPLYTDMYVKEYLRFVSGLHKMKGASKRIEEIISLTGLTPEAHKKIGMLSKGYRQRVGLAQALLHDPEVLVLDEPTSGLDPNQIVDIRNLIINSGKEKTVILSTHIMQEVQAMCSRVIIINKGKIVVDKLVSELLNQEKGVEILKVEFKLPVSEESLKGIHEGLKIENLSKGEGTKWSIQSNKDIREELFRFATANSNAILEMSKETQSLEGVFQELTKGNLEA